MYMTQDTNLVVDSHEEISGESLKRKVVLFCTDASTNFSADLNSSRSYYDVFTKTDMDNMVLFVEDVLWNGGHVHIFCLDLQFNCPKKQFRQITDTAHEPGDGAMTTMKGSL